MDPEVLAEAIDYDYEQLVEATYNKWDQGLSACNEGQSAIFDYYISWISEDILSFWAEEWPWVDAYEYYDSVMSAHYAMDETWSETTEEILYRQEEIIYQAQEKAFLLELLGFFV